MKVGDSRAATSSSPSATAGQRGSVSRCRCRESSGDPMGVFGVVGDTGELHQRTTTCGGGSLAVERSARTVGRCHSQGARPWSWASTSSLGVGARRWRGSLSSARGRAMGSNAVRGFAGHGGGVLERQPVLWWCPLPVPGLHAGRGRMGRWRGSDVCGGADAGLVRGQARCPRSDLRRSRRCSVRSTGRQLDRLMAEHTVAAPSVVHLHHLTPMHEAVRVLWPEVPVITHLHGTELKMLASVDRTIPDQPGRFSRTWVGADAAVGRRIGPAGGHLPTQPSTRHGPPRVDPARVTTDRQRGRHRDVLAPCSHDGPSATHGSVGSSTILVDGARVAPRDRSPTRPMTWRRSPMSRAAGSGGRVRWTVHAVQAGATPDRGPSLDAVDDGLPIRARDRWWLPRRMGG